MSKTNTPILAAHRWEVKKARLKVMFPDLTYADLNFSEFKKNEMVSKLRDKL